MQISGKYTEKTEFRRLPACEEYLKMPGWAPPQESSPLLKDFSGPMYLVKPMIFMLELIPNHQIKEVRRRKP